MPVCFLCEYGTVSQQAWLKLSIAYFFVALACLVWPVFPALGNSIDPRVWGLPWSLTYVLGIVVCNALVLGALYVSKIVDAKEPPPSTPTTKDVSS